MSAGLVSIVVPVHNRPEALVDAVESALAQTYRPIEILIVDDGSTDSTPDAVSALTRRAPDLVTGIRCENGGPGLAREAGRAAARGDFVQYLDSDDLLHPNKLELQVGALERDRSAGIAYCACREIDADGRARRPAVRPSDRPLDRMFPAFLSRRWWNTLVPLYRSDLLARVGAWSSLRYEEDWEYDVRVAALAPKLCFVPECLATVRDLGGASSSRAATLDRDRLADSAAAHLSILEAALRAGIDYDVPERKKFARELFLLCRQCGAAGLSDVSRRLFVAATRASTPQRARGGDFRLYRLTSRVLGWKMSGVLSLLVDRWRPASKTD